MPERTITYSLHAHALGPVPAMTRTIDEQKELLASVGADGLAIMPGPGAANWQILHQGERGDFTNTDSDGNRLVSSIQHPYAPTVQQAAGRQFGRYRSKGPDRQSLGQTVARFGMNLAQRALMPPATNAERSMDRLVRAVNDSDVFVEVPHDAFTKVGDQVTLAADKGTADRAVPLIAQLSPDLMERLGVEDIQALREILGNKRFGITGVSIDPFHLGRKSQTGAAKLPPYKTWLSDFIDQGLPVRRIGVSVKRKDMPQAAGMQAAEASVALGDALAAGLLRAPAVGPLRDLMGAVHEAQPNQPLDVLVTGRITGRLAIGQLTNIFRSLREL